MTPTLSLTAGDWWALCLHFMSLSLLAVGGAIITAPDMHRFLVGERGWLTDMQYNASIALAQAAPGPNVLFVALMGWHVGLNAGSAALGLLGVVLALGGILLPSTTLTYFAARWGHRNRELRAVRAFKAGMAPVVVALLIGTGWVMTTSHSQGADSWPLWLVTLVSALLVWRTKIHLLWLLGTGALLGGLGLLPV